MAVVEKKDEVTKCSGTSSQGFCEGEIIRKVRDAEEMEGWLGVVVKDRRRATDMLEVIIGTYGRLLGLLLKEANGGGVKEEECKYLDSSM